MKVMALTEEERIKRLSFTVSPVEALITIKALVQFAENDYNHEIDRGMAAEIVDDYDKWINSLKKEYNLDLDT